MAKDAGEALFEKYLDGRGYEVVAYEPDMGTGRRPDYLVRADDVTVVVEVKSFKEKIIALPSNGRLPSPKLKPIRRHIERAADQMRGIDGLPLVAVLVNPANAPIHLGHHEIMQAMYGEYCVQFEDPTGMSGHLGPNGQLHVEEPDGTEHGAHAYLSAVVALHDSPAPEAVTAAFLRESDHSPNSLVAYIAATARLEYEGRADFIARVDVFETVSTSAVPLPRTIFNGPTDTRWGRHPEWQYGPIAR